MVLVCHDPRFVFLKTMKTAGTSVELLFERFCLPEGHERTGKGPPVISDRGIVGARGTIERGRYEWWNHMPASEVAALMGEAEFDASFKFATVRNPYRAVLSRFFFQLKAPYPSTLAAFHLQRLRFRRWLGKRRNPQEFGNHGIVHLDGRFVLDDFIRQESMVEDIGRIATRLGLAVDPGSLRSSKRNTGSERFPPSAYFNARGIEAVEEAFGWCFDQCGYSRNVGEA